MASGGSCWITTIHTGHSPTTKNYPDKYVNGGDDEKPWSIVVYIFAV